MNATVHPLPHHVPITSVQGTLALNVLPHLDPPSPSAGPSVVRPPGSADVVDVDVRTRRDVEQWARRFAQAAVEIAGGERPASQLVRWTTGEVHADLRRRAHLVARARNREGLSARRRAQAARPQVVGLRPCFVREDAVEVSVHVRYGRRSRAVAARFEYRDERWVCTALEFA